TNPGTSTTHGPVSVTGPRRRPGQPIVSPVPARMPSPPAPAASGGEATLITIVGSSQPDSATGADAVSVTAGDRTVAGSRAAIVTSIGTTTPRNAGSYTGAPPDQWKSAGWPKTSQWASDRAAMAAWPPLRRNATLGGVTSDASAASAPA